MSHNEIVPAGATSQADEPLSRLAQKALLNLTIANKFYELETFANFLPQLKEINDQFEKIKTELSDDSPASEARRDALEQWDLARMGIIRGLGFEVALMDGEVRQLDAKSLSKYLRIIDPNHPLILPSADAYFVIPMDVISKYVYDEEALAEVKEWIARETGGTADGPEPPNAPIEDDEEKSVEDGEDSEKGEEENNSQPASE